MGIYCFISPPYRGGELRTLFNGFYSLLYRGRTKRLHPYEAFPLTLKQIRFVEEKRYCLHK